MHPGPSCAPDLRRNLDMWHPQIHDHMQNWSTMSILWHYFHYFHHLAPYQTQIPLYHCAHTYPSHLQQPIPYKIKPHIKSFSYYIPLCFSPIYAVTRQEKTTVFYKRWLEVGNYNSQKIVRCIQCISSPSNQMVGCIHLCKKCTEPVNYRGFHTPSSEHPMTQILYNKDNYYRNKNPPYRGDFLSVC